MPAGRMRVVMLFLDGVGLGPAERNRNALARANLPIISGLLEGRAPTLEATRHRGATASLVGLDACLGVDGLPQSGTGQTALFTGLNAPRSFGRHFGPWVPSRLRPVLRDKNLLSLARAAGRRVAFANAYPEEVVASVAESRATVASAASRRRLRRAAQFLHAGPPLAAAGAGVLNRHTEHLATGDAVASEITNDGWRTGLGRTEVPVIQAAEAGVNLARIANAHDLTLFAHYSTDHAGHREDIGLAVAAIERVDAFLGGLLERLEPDVLTVVVSDHGNLEDCTTGHTRNPALALTTGLRHAVIARDWSAVTDVTPSLLEALRIPPSGT